MNEGKHLFSERTSGTSPFINNDSTILSHQKRRNEMTKNKDLSATTRHNDRHSSHLVNRRPSGSESGKNLFNSLDITTETNLRVKQINSSRMQNVTDSAQDQLHIENSGEYFELAENNHSEKPFVYSDSIRSSSDNSLLSKFNSKKDENTFNFKSDTTKTLPRHISDSGSHESHKHSIMQHRHGTGGGIDLVKDSGILEIDSNLSRRRLHSTHSQTIDNVLSPNKHNFKNSQAIRDIAFQQQKGQQNTHSFNRTKSFDLDERGESLPVFPLNLGTRLSTASRESSPREVNGSTARTPSYERISDRDLGGCCSEADKKHHHFKVAREVGKTICVCGASAYWERERISIGKERLRLKQESERLRAELSTMRETRQRISARLLDLENMENQIAGRIEIVIAKEAAVDEDSRRIEKQHSDIKHAQCHLDKKEIELTQKEKEFEILRRKQEKEAFDVKEKAAENLAESNQLCELSTKLSQREIKLQNEEQVLSAAKKDYEDTLQNIHKQKQELENQEKKYAEQQLELHNEEERLRRWEKTLFQKEDSLTMDRRDVENIRTLNEKMKLNLDKRSTELISFKEQLEFNQNQLNTNENAFELEKEAFKTERNKEESEWKLSIEKQQQDIREQMGAIDRRKRKNEDTQASLELYEKELNDRAQRNKIIEDTLDEQGKQLVKKEEKIAEMQAELENEKKYIESERLSLCAKAQTIEQQEARLSAKMHDFQKAQDAEQKKREEVYAKEARIKDTEAGIIQKENDIRKREAVLYSVEARSEWHKGIMKDRIDAQDRFELERQDFELEKRAFAEMKAKFVAAQESMTSALKKRELSSASLEIKIRNREREVIRQEKLLKSRIIDQTPGLKHKPLTVSPQHLLTDRSSKLKELSLLNDKSLNSSLAGFTQGTRLSKFPFEFVSDNPTPTRHHMLLHPVTTIKDRPRCHSVIDNEGLGLYHTTSPSSSSYKKPDVVSFQHHYNDATESRNNSCINDPLNDIYPNRFNPTNNTETTLSQNGHLPGTDGKIKSHHRKHSVDAKKKSSRKRSLSNSLKKKQLQHNQNSNNIELLSSLGLTNLTSPLSLKEHHQTYSNEYISSLAHLESNLDKCYETNTQNDSCTIQDINVSSTAPKLFHTDQRNSLNNKLSDQEITRPRLLGRKIDEDANEEVVIKPDSVSNKIETIEKDSLHSTLLPNLYIDQQSSTHFPIDSFESLMATDHPNLLGFSAMSLESPILLNK